MEDYQGNSKKNESKGAPPPKDLGKVVTGEVIVKPKSLTSRIKSLFFGGDVDSAARYVTSEVLLPALRNLVVDTISRGADRLVYGDSGYRRRAPTGYAPRVQYNNPINRAASRTAYLPDQRPVDRWSRGNASSKSFDNVIVGTKEEADTVVENLINVVEMYEVVSVADLYELLGLASTHVDNKWGWTHLGSIEVQQVREGWRIEFPPLEEIE
jgi:hypothetical protein